MSDQLSFEDTSDLVTVRAAWDNALCTLGGEVSAAVYSRFLKPLSVSEFVDGTVVFSAPGAFIVEWVRERFQARLLQAIEDELGRPVRIEVRARTREKPAMDDVVSHKLVTVKSDASADSFKPLDKYKFDTFVVGQSNRYAHAGARAIAADPGMKYNPLFIYGNPGLGKTHLLHAIAHEILQYDPKQEITYITAQSFAEQFVQALQSNRIEQFRRSQRSAGIWLIDDIQFIAGKDKTSEEIFHTFNTLQQVGKQIVICADRPPRELYGMDERLKSRFEAGLVVDIQAPDTETKSAILLKKSEPEGIDLSPEIALYIASNVAGNVRVLEGALNRIVALSSVEETPISIDFVSDVIDRYYRSHGQARPAFNTIVESVGKYYKIPNEEIMGISRKAPITHARHVAVYITREITGDSWKHIGSLFGDRDHTSMMHAHQKISIMLSQDRDLSAAVEVLLRDLNPR